MPDNEELQRLDADIQVAKTRLRAAGVPSRLLTPISTRALRSGRRQTGEFPTNRASRWTLTPQDPQYGTEADCKRILLKLYAQLMTFDNAPAIDDDTAGLLEPYLGTKPVPGTFTDSLTMEHLSFESVVAEADSPTHGRSAIHLGHEDPSQHPKHTPGNVAWRTERSNLFQGNLTLRAARIEFLKMTARYFDLGEIAIDIDQGDPSA
jgi:hypothetical protein